MEKTKETNETKKRTSTTVLVEVSMFAAILAILSQVSIPMPTGVPITLQTFAVALIGVVLAWKYGAVSVIVYILLGAVGAPVFTGFHGGAQTLAGYTGGFIWGFIFMAMLCGVGTLMKNKIAGVAVGIVGLAVCHLLGTVQFMVIMQKSFAESFLLVSVPYLIKDVISVILAFIVGGEIRKRLVRMNLLQ